MTPRSKVLEVVDNKDKRGRRLIEYLIHFQGWNSSWDRRVSEDFILKDNEENRQLQKELAEKSQLHLGAYLYRKERKNRSRNLSERIDGIRNQGGSSEEGSSCSTGFGRDDADYSISNAEDLDTEYYSSSVESSHEDDKVYIQVGDKIRKYLELDYNLIFNEYKLVELPSKLPIVTILENYVRHYAIKQLCGPTQEQSKSRRRNSQAKNEQKPKDYEHIKTTIELSKEVADGLRLYFDFTLKNYLLYQAEKQQAEQVLSEENLKNFTYIASDNLSLDMLTVKESPEGADHCHDNAESTSTTSNAVAEEKRRRLRSHKNEENEFILDFGVIKQDNMSVASTSSDGSVQNSMSISSSMKILKSALPLNIGITSASKEILNDVFSWKILPSDAPASPSMIYGAVHLARLLVKLPDFLSASPMPDEKLKLLLKYLDSFVEYFEEHEEWFGNQFYFDRESQGNNLTSECVIGETDILLKIKQERM